MKVIFSEQADRDLHAIAVWISGDRPNAARKVIRALQAKCATLGKQPYVYQFVEGREADGVRRAPCSRYLILYRVEVDRISIVRRISPTSPSLTAP